MGRLYKKIQSQFLPRRGKDPFVFVVVVVVVVLFVLFVVVALFFSRGEGEGGGLEYISGLTSHTNWVKDFNNQHRIEKEHARENNQRDKTDSV